MKKRLSKKTREFQEKGLHAGFKFPKEFTDKKIDYLIEKFILEAVEKNLLIFEGGGVDGYKGFISAGKSGTNVTEDQKKAVIRWFEKEECISLYYVSPLTNTRSDNMEKNDMNWIRKG